MSLILSNEDELQKGIWIWHVIYFRFTCIFRQEGEVKLEKGMPVSKQVKIFAGIGLYYQADQVIFSLVDSLLIQVDEF